LSYAPDSGWQCRGGGIGDPFILHEARGSVYACYYFRIPLG